MQFILAANEIYKRLLTILSTDGIADAKKTNTILM